MKYFKKRKQAKLRDAYRRGYEWAIYELMIEGTPTEDIEIQMWRGATYFPTTDIETHFDKGARKAIQHVEASRKAMKELAHYRSIG